PVISCGLSLAAKSGPSTEGYEERLKAEGGRLKAVKPPTAYVFSPDISWPFHSARYAFRAGARLCPKDQPQPGPAWIWLPYVLRGGSTLRLAFQAQSRSNAKRVPG